MILLIHILIALSSIGVATVTLFKPTSRSLMASYGLISATIGSGIMLMILSPKSILHACISGLIYVSIVTVMTVFAHGRARKLATEAAQ